MRRTGCLLGVISFLLGFLFWPTWILTIVGAILYAAGHRSPSDSTNRKSPSDIPTNAPSSPTPSRQAPGEEPAAERGDMSMLRGLVIVCAAVILLVAVALISHQVEQSGDEAHDTTLQSPHEAQESAAIPPDVVDRMEELLDPDGYVRRSAALELGLMGESGRAALSRLARMEVADPLPDARSAATWALDCILGTQRHRASDRQTISVGSDLEHVTVEKLQGLLLCEDPGDRRDAALELGKRRRDAQSALERLRQIERNDSVPQVAQAAFWAITQIRKGIQTPDEEVD